MISRSWYSGSKNGPGRDSAAKRIAVIRHLPALQCRARSGRSSPAISPWHGRRVSASSTSASTPPGLSPAGPSSFAVDPRVVLQRLSLVADSGEHVVGLLPYSRPFLRLLTLFGLLVKFGSHAFGCSFAKRIFKKLTGLKAVASGKTLRFNFGLAGWRDRDFDRFHQARSPTLIVSLTLPSASCCSATECPLRRASIVAFSTAYACRESVKLLLLAPFAAEVVVFGFTGFGVEHDRILPAGQLHDQAASGAGKQLGRAFGRLIELQTLAGCACCRGVFDLGLDLDDMGQIGVS